MIDHLLQFEDEATAIAALPKFRDEAGWAAAVLPVQLVTAEAEFGDPDGDGFPTLTAERETMPGFWLLAPEAGLPGEAAQIERDSGHIVAGNESLAGVHLDPVWAGMSDAPLALHSPSN